MRILIIKLGAIGDVIRTTSILPMLKEKYKASITWVTKTESISLLKNNYNINNLYSIEDLNKEILNQKYDLVINFEDEKWISNNETLELKIEDEVSGVSSYRATINGKYILTEYDYKKDVLVYDFEDKVVSETENNLKLIVVDNVGNSTTFEATFFRKQL